MARTILVVDDSKSVRTALRWVFRKSGDTVVTAASFDEAKGHDAPDVAIIDYHLPEGSSAELAEHFVGLGARTVVMYGDYNAFDRSAFETAGVTSFVEKPFTSDSVIDAIERDAPAPVETETAEADVPPTPPREERGTMSLKGKPRPTEDDAGVEEVAAKPASATPVSPTAVTNAMDTSDLDEADNLATEVADEAEEEVVAASPEPTEGDKETTTEVAAAADPAPSAPATPAGPPSSEAAPAPTAASIGLDKAVLRKIVENAVRTEVKSVVDNLVRDELEKQLPAVVKDAVREMLREELNAKVVNYSKRKIDSFINNDLPRIAERVVDRKT